MRNVFTAIFKFIVRLLAVFLALLTVIATIVVVLLSSIEHTLLNPETQRQAFVKNKVYEQFPDAAAKEFSLAKKLFADRCAETPQACANETVALLNGMSSRQWETLIIHLLPTDELQMMTESTLDKTIGYFHGQTDSVQMSLAPLKARLTSQAGEEITALLLGSQPSCSTEQLAQMKAVDINVAGALPIFCSDTGEIQLSAELQRRLNNVSAELPEAAIVIKSPSPSIPPNLRKFFGEDRQSALQRVNMALPYSPLLPLALLLLLALFAVHSLRGWMRWWGIPIFIAGLLTLIFGIVLFFMFDQIWTKYILHTLPPLLASGFGEITQDVARTLTNDLAKWTMLQSGFLTLLALGIIYASSFVKPPPDPSLPPLAQPGTPGGPVIHPEQEKEGEGGKTLPLPPSPALHQTHDLLSKSGASVGHPPQIRQIIFFA